MDRTLPIYTGARPALWTGYSKVRSQAICRWSSRRGSSSSLTEARRRRSASSFLQRYYSGLTLSLDDVDPIVSPEFRRAVSTKSTTIAGVPPNPAVWTSPVVQGQIGLTEAQRATL